jgi:hypothetical protein
MTRKLDLTTIVGLVVLAGVALGLYAVYDFSSVPPARSFMGLVTGYALAFAMVGVWLLPVFGRRGPPRNLEAYKAIHRMIGIGILVVLFIHARSAGHAMLLALMASTLIMALLAFFQVQVQAMNRPVLLTIWWVVHVGLAAAISVMAILHVYAQYAYFSAV